VGSALSPRTELLRSLPLWSMNRAPFTPAVRQLLLENAGMVAFNQQLVPHVSKDHATQPPLPWQYAAHVLAVEPDGNVKGIPGRSPPFRSTPIVPTFNPEVRHVSEVRVPPAVFSQQVAPPHESYDHALHPLFASHAEAQPNAEVTETWVRSLP